MKSVKQSIMFGYFENAGLEIIVTKVSYITKKYLLNDSIIIVDEKNTR